ncbi:MAG: hypothetical protein JST40_09730 [Armatimonadetes bacterium]|nr:hypothetical protein [Armatimonadota bacterium]
MKKGLFGALALLAASAVFAAPFTPGNLVVSQLGDDSGTAFSSAATKVYLKEYTPAGVLVQTIEFPSSGTGTKLVNGGTATSAGQLSYYNGFFAVSGYNADLGTASIGTSAVASVSRVVATVDSNGNYTLTPITDAYDGNNIRSAVSDGTGIWMAGTAGTGLTATAGFRYAAVSTVPTTSIQLVDTPTNCRVVNIYNGQLYGSTGSTAFAGMGTIGTGLPTTGGQTTQLLAVDPITSPAASMYDFVVDGNTIYACDDRNGANGGGIVKFVFDGSTWNVAYRLSAGLPETSSGSGIPVGVRSVSLVKEGGNNRLYVVSGEGSGRANGIHTLVDTGASSTFSLVVASNAFTDFRGVRAVPASSSARTLSGSVDFGPGYIGNGPVAVTFTIGSQTKTVNVNPANPTYSFTLDANITGNSYSVSADAETHLRRLKSVNLGANGGTLNFDLVNGDCDGDGAVTIFDYILISDSFDSSVGDSRYLAGADLDKDDSVTIFDYVILSDSFDKVDE